MKPAPHNILKAEENRIQGVYTLRKDENRYSWFSPGQFFMDQTKEKKTLDLLKQYQCTNLEDKKILEIGCGSGHWLREFIKWGAQPENVTGIDLLPDRVDTAKHLSPQSVKLLCGSATELEFANDHFDLLLQSTVFTSILDSTMKEKIAGEMLRVVKPNGLILWYDYHVNNPWNPDVRGVKKREIHKLFPNCRIDLRRITLAPPLVRFLAPYSWLACYLLTKIPFLCTHYLGVIQKGSPVEK